jgi:AraC family transcriptional regulator
MYKEETLNYYEYKVREVITYVHDNPDGELNIKALSEKFNISYFHFQRIMRAALNEPLGNYINRVRLNKSAQLIRESGESISEIAGKSGYNDLSAFSKSFVKEFGMSPNEYRLNVENSVNIDVDFHFNNSRVVDSKLNPKIKVFQAKKIIYVEVKGRYGGESGTTAWNMIERFAAKAKIITWNPEIFCIYYDDPDIVGENNCNYDCCLTVRKKVEPDGFVNVKELEGGKYLVFRYKGPYDSLWDVYNLLYRDYIILLDKYQLRDAPVLEKYIRYSEKTKPENLITEICLPIE